jgi:tetratricopeptide (TPR) repeat protein
MKPTNSRRLLIVLPLAAYAIILWRSLYGLKHASLGILDWASVAFGLGLWSLIRLKRGATWPSLNHVDRPLLAWLALTVLTALFSVNPRASFEAVWITLTNILILYLLVDAIRRGWGSALLRSLYLLGGVVFLLSILEIVAWYTGIPLFPTIQQGWLSIGGVNAPFPPVLHRISYALITSTALSGFVALLIPPALCTLPTARDRDTRIALLVWLGAAGITLFLSLSRNGFLALGTSLVIIALGSVRSPQFRRWWKSLPRIDRLLALGAILVATVMIMVVGLFLATRLAQHQSGDAVRLDLWRSAAEMFRDHPLTGVGPGAYGTALRQYRNPLLARDHTNEAHNIYLEAGAERGILGLIIGGWMLLALVWAWWRRWRSEAPGSPGWWRILGLGATLIGLGARSLVESFYNSAIVLPTLLFVAFILASPRKREQRSSMRWKWSTVAIALALAALLLAWDSWGQVNFNRSLAATANNEIEAALPAVNRARKIDPWMPLYACHTGYLYGRRAAEGDQESLTLALDEYQACVEEMPTGWIDQLNRATLLWRAGRHTEARIALQKATAENPMEWLLWLNRGYMAEVSGDRADAVRSYGWVLSHDPQLAGSPFWEQGERPEMWEDILVAGADALQGRGVSEADQVRWRWSAAGAHGDWAAVLPQIEDWLTTHPNDAEALALVGEALLGLNRSQEAFSWLERAVSADQSRARSYIVRGEAALALGYRDEAEQDLRTALFIEPDPQAHFGLARLFQVRGDTESALGEFSESLEHVVLKFNYDRVLYRRAGWPDALPQVVRISYRHHGEAALQWGALLEQEGNPDLAQRIYTAALEVDPYWQVIRNRIDD